MSYSYDRYEQRTRQSYGASSRRTTFGYWVPLALTVTVATAGLIAWIWKERSDDDDDYDGDRKDSRPPPRYGDVGPGHTAFVPGAEPPPQPPRPQIRQVEEEGGVMARMSGALRRTPSPQQIFDEASRRVAAGVSAAGAAVGGALSSIREEDKGDYEDHSRWSEEAAGRAGMAGQGAVSGARGQTTGVVLGAAQIPFGERPVHKRRTVAIVLSAEVSQHGSGLEDAAYYQEHASILSHLPQHDNGSHIFVLIYSPNLKQHPLSANARSSKVPPSVTSSYSNIGYEDLQTPAEELEKPLTTVDPQPISNGGSDTFNALYRQAQAITEKPTMIMPFTTPAGYVHILRHIAPEVVYVQANLSGKDGEAVKHMSGWAGQVVLVVGDETGHGGLVDSEDERGAIGEEARESRWWQNDSRVGLGKGIEVVEGLRLGEDWRRRVRGHD